MTRDLHLEPFDEGTVTKLTIFQEYLKTWLPVFIKQQCKTIYIADLFAGPGKDKEGNPGSPLRIVDTLFLFKEDILAEGLRIEVIFNELDPKKYKELKNSINAAQDKIFYEPRIYNEKFIHLFDRVKPELTDAPCLLFLDQNGIIQINQRVLNELEKLKRTDFLFFISSSYFFRFKDDPTFRRHFSELSSSGLVGTNYNHVHRRILDHYKRFLSGSSTLRLYPFSIKKGANIYGLIFGSRHILGADKFLQIAWDLNKINGEANFDIDDDQSKKEQPALFEEYKRVTKLEEFKEILTEFIAGKGELSNKKIYDFAIDNGFTHKHATDILKDLIKEGKVKKMFSERGLYVGYRQCYRDEKIANFKWID